ncbi:MAG: hypothetical protein LBO00_10225 [Zoogloeaceae bacterium]|jgi:hypothetical protein|nr:hypothetical protein [Zoogloeaceae bacterium]
MSGNSTSILSQVATSMMNFGAPMLLDEKDLDEAERMAEAGLLQRHEPVFKSFGYSLTDAGIVEHHKACRSTTSRTPRTASVSKSWTPPRSRLRRMPWPWLHNPFHSPT